MTVKEQILELFNQLFDTARCSVLQELNSQNVLETILVEDAHCTLKTNSTKIL